MNEGHTQLKDLTANVNAYLHVVKKTLSADRANWRRQGGPLRPWAAFCRTVLPLLVYAVGFLVAESAAWQLHLALSPKVEASTPLFIQGAVTVAALLLVLPKRWWLYLIVTLLLLPANAW
jgi:hypothetical protein